MHHSDINQAVCSGRNRLHLLVQFVPAGTMCTTPISSHIVVRVATVSSVSMLPFFNCLIICLFCLRVRFSRLYTYMYNCTMLCAHYNTLTRHIFHGKSNFLYLEHSLNLEFLICILDESNNSGLGRCLILRQPSCECLQSRGLF